jgi:hypothetical protein
VRRSIATGVLSLVSPSTLSRPRRPRLARARKSLAERNRPVGHDSRARAVIGRAGAGGVCGPRGGMCDARRSARDETRRARGVGGVRSGESEGTRRNRNRTRD